MSKIDQLPKFSIVIGSARKWLELKQTLIDLVNQSYPQNKFEVIVVRNHTREKINLTEQKKLQLNLRVVKMAATVSTGISTARNFGISLAQADKIICIDDDCRVPPDLLKNYDLAWRDHSSATIMGGRVEFDQKSLPSSKQQLISQHFWCFGLINYGPKDRLLHSGEPVYGANMSFSRHKVGQLAGGFFWPELGVSLGNSKRMIGGEDWEFCERVIKLGGQVWYASRCWVSNEVGHTRFSWSYLMWRYWLSGIERVRLEKHLNLLFTRQPFQSLIQEKIWMMKTFLKHRQPVKFDFANLKLVGLHLTQLLSYLIALIPYNFKIMGETASIE